MRQSFGLGIDEEEEKLHKDFVSEGEKPEHSAWKQFKEGAHRKAIAGTRWPPTWPVVDGQNAVRARFAAKGYQGPDLNRREIDIAGCASERSPH